jgi:hypothetical protein
MLTATTCAQCGAVPASERPDARFPLCEPHYESWKGWMEGLHGAALLAIGDVISRARYWGVSDATIREAVRIELANEDGLESDDAFRLARAPE